MKPTKAGFQLSSADKPGFMRVKNLQVTHSPGNTNLDSVAGTKLNYLSGKLHVCERLAQASSMLANMDICAYK